jgi:hypothetical protein
MFSFLFISTLHHLATPISYYPCPLSFTHSPLPHESSNQYRYRSPLPVTSSADDQYCSEFNITLPQLLRTPESSTTSAYARYILDIGTQGDILELYVAIAACLIGYGEVGLWLQKQVALGEAKVEGNMYKRWMEDYGGEDFLGAVDRGIGAFPSSSLHSPLSPLMSSYLVSSYLSPPWVRANPQKT